MCAFFSVFLFFCVIKSLPLVIYPLPILHAISTIIISPDKRHQQYQKWRPEDNGTLRHNALWNCILLSKHLVMSVAQISCALTSLPNGKGSNPSKRNEWWSFNDPFFLPWSWTLILDPSSWSWILILKDSFYQTSFPSRASPPLNTGSHFRVLCLLAACPTFKNMPSVKGTCAGCMCSVLEQKNVLWEVIWKSSVNCWTLVNSLLPAHFHIKFKDFQGLTFLFSPKLCNANTDRYLEDPVTWSFWMSCG